MTALYRLSPSGGFICRIFQDGKEIDHWSHPNLYWLFRWKQWCYPNARTVDA